MDANGWRITGSEKDYSGTDGDVIGSAIENRKIVIDLAATSDSYVDLVEAPRRKRCRSRTSGVVSNPHVNVVKRKRRRPKKYPCVVLTDNTSVKGIPPIGRDQRREKFEGQSFSQIKSKKQHSSQAVRGFKSTGKTNSTKRTTNDFTSRQATKLITGEHNLEEGRKLGLSVSQIGRMANLEREKTKALSKSARKA